MNDAVTVTYQDLEPALHRLARTAAYRYSLNLDEAMAEASRLFWSAYESFDPSLNDDFEGYMSFRVRRGLIGYARGLAKQAANAPQAAGDAVSEFVQAAKPDAFDLEAILRGLSLDGIVAVLLVTDMPRDLHTAIQAKGGQEQNYRSSVRQYLRYRLGWSAERVKRAFDEVRESI